MIPFLAFIAVICIIALLTLWCYITKQELRQKMDMVKSAESQLKACVQTLQTLDDVSQADQSKAIAKRCWDIYLQAVSLYNDTLSRPVYRIPAAIMHYQSINVKQILS